MSIVSPNHVMFSIVENWEHLVNVVCRCPPDSRSRWRIVHGGVGDGCSGSARSLAPSSYSFLLVLRAQPAAEIGSSEECWVLRIQVGNSWAWAVVPVCKWRFWEEVPAYNRRIWKTLNLVDL